MRRDLAKKTRMRAAFDSKPSPRRVSRAIRYFQFYCTIDKWFSQTLLVESSNFLPFTHWLHSKKMDMHFADKYFFTLSPFWLVFSMDKIQFEKSLGCNIWRNIIYDCIKNVISTEWKANTMLAHSAFSIDRWCILIKKDMSRFLISHNKS